jgi:hypothetical protein
MIVRSHNKMVATTSKRITTTTYLILYMDPLWTHSYAFIHIWTQLWTHSYTFILIWTHYGPIHIRLFIYEADCHWRCVGDLHIENHSQRFGKISITGLLL